VAAGVLAPIGGPTWEGRGVTPDVETDPDDALPVAIATLRRLEETR
jgi:carboxyl-terminal processing protease